MMKIKSYLMAAVGFGILVGSIILAQPFVSHSQNQVPPIPVEVINTPLEIRTVEAPPCCVPRQPFRKLVGLVGDNGENAAFSNFVVPGGKRLVIENVSVLGSLPHGEQLQVGFNYSSSPSFVIRQDFPVTFQMSEALPPQDFYVASQQMRVYVDPGSVVELRAFRNPTHGAFKVEFSISGFLVDL
ncbi:MAG TPA: hypothetical protein VFF31_26995 [Blastocatellia bacterium]|nr:hypothetical protein [Blastocatellia bacterium]